MAVSSFTVEKQVEEAVRGLPDNNYMLGRGLMQPFKPSNSGSRALMSAIHTEHHMVPTHGEVPLVQTGYETEFGQRSSSYVQSDDEYRVLHRIDKFSFNQNHYYLIIQSLTTGQFDYIERVTYRHNTQSYGFMWDNSRIDHMKIGDVIHRGDVIKTSRGFDEYGNKMCGVNLITAYLACATNMEDSVIISESCAKKLETNLIKNNAIVINENDTLLNIYGTPDRHKAFPDIGEAIEDGLFCVIRRTENRDLLFTHEAANLTDFSISDRKIGMDGYVCDIDVYCNNTRDLGDQVENAQLYMYHQEKINFCKQVYDIVTPYAMNGKLSYGLSKLYARCRDAINGKEYFKDRPFTNVILEVTVMEPLPMHEGDKISDRYGGKGVVSAILPDDKMPMLDNGLRVDIIKNQSTCINRENLGQMFELSENFRGMRLIDYFKTGLLSYSEMCKLWFRFVDLIDHDEAMMGAGMMLDFYDEDQCRCFIDSVIQDGGIIISSPPFTTPMNIDKLREIDKEFPWIKPYKVYVPMEDSTGKTRYIRTRRDLVIGQIYHYRLKQYAEEKFSVTSLAATNLKNLNTRSKANKVYEARYAKTPIMFGAMETGDLGHIGMAYVVMTLMLYSSSPQARRLFEGLLTGDPYNIDIKLDYDSRNRNAEIIAALFKNMGLELVFKKVPKEKKELCKKILYKTIPNSEFNHKSAIRDIIGYDDMLPLMCTRALQHKDGGVDMVKNILAKRVDENGRKVFKTSVGELLESLTGEE